MGELRIAQKIRDAIVARPRHQTVAVAEKEIEPQPGREASFLKLNCTKHIIDKNRSVVGRSRNKRAKRPQRRDFKHGKKPPTLSADLSKCHGRDEPEVVKNKIRAWM
jgi:hypothetical protein